MHMISIRLYLLPFLCAALLCAAGCGESDEDDASSSSNGQADASVSEDVRSDTGGTTATDTGATADTSTVAEDTSTGEDTTEVDTAEPDAPSYDEEVTAYCDCMFLSCHDLYHDIWGEDEVEARFGCLDEAQPLPRANTDAEEGNNLDCRANQCSAEQCPAAAGQEICVD